MTLGYRRFNVILLVALSVSACENSDSDDRPPPEPASLTLKSVRPAPLAAEPDYDATAPAVLPCSGALVAFVEVSPNFDLRRAGECSDTPRCGHVVLRAAGPAGEKVVRSGTPTVFLPLTEQQDPNAPTASVEAWAGSVGFEGELTLDDGSPFLNPDGDRVRSSLTLELLPPSDCGAVGEGPPAD